MKLFLFAMTFSISCLTFGARYECANENVTLIGDVSERFGFSEPLSRLPYLFRGNSSGPTLSGFRFIPVSPTQDLQYFQPTQEQWTAPASAVVTVTAFPGETEPVSFAILATEDLTDVIVSLGDLVGPHTIGTSCIDTMMVVRNLKRSYPSNAFDTAEVWNQWMPRWTAQSIAIPAGHFRQAMIDIEVPLDAPAGEYRGTINIISTGKAARQIPLTLKVQKAILPTAMSPTLKHKAICFEYPRAAMNSATAATTKAALQRRVLSELQAYRKSGVRSLQAQVTGGYTPFKIQKNATGEFIFDPSELNQFLAIAEKAGIDGYVYVSLNWNFLMSGYTPVTDWITTRDASGNTKIQPSFVNAFSLMMKYFSKGYRTPVAGLPSPLCVKCPTLMLQVKDEVQGEDNATDSRVNRFIDFSKHIAAWNAANTPSGWPKVLQSATLSLYTGNEETYLDNTEEVKKLTPFLAFPMPSLSFDTWIWYGKPTARTSFNHYRDMLRQYGQTAWHYTWFGARTDAVRFVRAHTGIYTWASDFTAALNWGSQTKDAYTLRWTGSPFDDADYDSLDAECSGTYVANRVTESQRVSGKLVPGCDSGDWAIMAQGYANDPTAFIRSRQLLGIREGADDLAYLQALENQLKIAAPNSSLSSKRSAAQNFLDRIRAMIRMEAIPAAIAGSQPVNCSLNIGPLDSRIVYGQADTTLAAVDSASKASSLVYSLAGRLAYKRFNKGEDWDCFRSQLVAHLENLSQTNADPIPIPDPPAPTPTPTPVPPSTTFLKKFDFAVSASNATDGYQNVLQTDRYTTARGWGWRNGVVTHYDRNTSDPLKRDVAVTSYGVFVVDIPTTGTYRVRVMLGDTEARPKQAVVVNGNKQPAIATKANEYLEVILDRTMTGSVEIEIRGYTVNGAATLASVSSLTVEKIR